MRIPFLMEVKILNLIGGEDFKGAISPAVDSKGNIFFLSGDGVYKCRFDDGTCILVAGGSRGNRDGIGSDAGFHAPLALILDEQENIIVADSFNHTIRRIFSDGLVETIAGIPEVSGRKDGKENNTFSCPYGMALDKEGNLFIADSDNHCIRKLDKEGYVSTIAGISLSRGYRDGSFQSSLFWEPTGLDFEKNGDLVITDSSNNVIRRIYFGGGDSGEGEGKESTYDVVTLCGSNIQVGSNDGCRDVSFSHPIGITVAGDGSIFIADNNQSLIRRIVPSDTHGYNVSTVIAYTNGREYPFVNPESVVWTKDGHLLVTELDKTWIKILKPLQWKSSLHKLFSNQIKDQIHSIMILALKNQVDNKPKYPQCPFYKVPKDILFVIFQFLGT